MLVNKGDELSDIRINLIITGGKSVVYCILGRGSMAGGLAAAVHQQQHAVSSLFIFDLVAIKNYK